MNFLKNIALVVVAIVIAGCTSGSGGSVNFSQTKGADIIDFGFDTPYIEDFGDQAVLTVGFQNVGGKTMSGATELFIYNAPMTDNPTAEPRKWNVISPTEQLEKNATTGEVLRLVWSLPTTTFYPPDPQTGQPGMADNYIVILQPPKQDEGMIDIPYTFETRLCYPYKTTTSSIIRATAQDSYVAADSKKSLAETQASAGPIQIALKAGQNIRANIGGGTVRIPLVFEVRDVGGGFATDTGVSCTPLVQKADIGVLNATVYIDGVEMDCGLGQLYIRNGVGNLYCTGEFANQNPKSEYHIVAQTSYNYYVSRAATIKVSDSRDTGDIDEA